jgi:hypothetical protein
MARREGGQQVQKIGSNKGVARAGNKRREGGNEATKHKEGRGQRVQANEEGRRARRGNK